MRFNEPMFYLVPTLRYYVHINIEIYGRIENLLRFRVSFFMILERGTFYANLLNRL
jgi:hypothetical protein